MNSDLVFIIGRQRSGTTVFRDFLETNGAFNADEVFHGDLNAPYRFYSFVLEKIAENPISAHVQEHRYLFDGFIDHLREIAFGKPVLIDVKYFALNFLPAPSIARDTPYIFDYIRATGANCVHLVRRNKLRVFVSEKLAEKNGVWSARSVENRPSDRIISIDPALALDFVETSLLEDKVVRRIVAGLPKARSFDYEELFDCNGDFTPAVIDCAREILNANIGIRSPPNIRLNPEPLHKLVSNFDDLYAIFNRTVHAWMVDD